jgi:hypothetical protein
VIGVRAPTDSEDRSHIVMTDAACVRQWTRHFKVTKHELQRAVDKVGNSVIAVRKELGLDHDGSAKPPAP